jgi:ketosteroid isomerase-like protein
MDKDERTLRKYWTSLAAVDAEAMAACYAQDATFRDPVFELQGPDIGAMWKMLFSGARGLKIVTGPLEVRDGAAEGTWKATYAFSKNGRVVHNTIHATLRARDGEIVEQVETFPFWKWSRMALGMKGTLLGWTPLVRNAVRRQAQARLAAARSR